MGNDMASLLNGLMLNGQALRPSSQQSTTSSARTAATTPDLSDDTLSMTAPMALEVLEVVAAHIGKRPLSRGALSSLIATLTDVVLSGRSIELMRRTAAWRTAGTGFPQGQGTSSAPHDHETPARGHTAEGEGVREGAGERGVIFGTLEGVGGGALVMTGEGSTGEMAGVARLEAVIVRILHGEFAL